MIICGFVTYFIFDHLFIGKIDEIAGAQWGNMGLKARLIAVAFLIAFAIFTFLCASSYFESNSSSTSNSKYDYITNSDGTRTWYDTTNDHIVKFD